MKAWEALKLRLLWSKRWDYLTFRTREKFRNFLRKPFEPEFEIFRYLDSSEGDFVDIGANRGQSALACLRAKPDFKVISFEPNEDMKPFLDSVKKDYPNHFEYHFCGICEFDRKAILQIPITDKHRFHEEGSVVEGWLDSAPVKSAFEKYRVAEDLRLEKREVQMRRLDSFEVKPRVIKVDVQGHEEEVLKGSMQIIREFKPILIIEENPVNRQNIQNLMSGVGYLRKQWDHKKQRLKDDNESVQLNCVYVFEGDPILKL